MAYIGQREDEWEAEQKKKALAAKNKQNGKMKCPICEKKLGDLGRVKNHMRDAHDWTTEQWKKYIAMAEQTNERPYPPVQIIMTVEEYDRLNKLEEEAKNNSEKIIQDLCTRVANSEILADDHWRSGTWGCILTRTTEYCDDCPCVDICPYKYKQWSK